MRRSPGREVRQALKWAIDYESIQKHIVPDTCL
jgi:hypothetical protein